MIAFIDVARQQRRAVGVGAGDNERRYAGDVRRKTRGREHTNEMRYRHEHFAAEVAAFFLGGELILEVNACGARFDHHLHQLEGIEASAEACFGIGDDRRKPVGAVASFAGVDLIRSLQRLIDALDDLRHGVRWIQTLIGVHVAGQVRVGGNLPAA